MECQLEGCLLAALQAEPAGSYCSLEHRVIAYRKRLWEQWVRRLEEAFEKAKIVDTSDVDFYRQLDAWQLFLNDTRHVAEPLTRVDMVAAAQRVVAQLGWKAGQSSKG